MILLTEKSFSFMYQPNLKSIFVQRNRKTIQTPAKLQHQLVKITFV